MRVAERALAVAFGICGAVAISFVLDYFLVLPVGVRIVFLLGGMALLGRELVVRVGAALARSVSAEEAARLLERARPELRQCLITAVQLTRPGSEVARYISPSLLASAVAEAERAVAGWKAREVLPARAIWRKTAQCAVAVAILAVAGSLDPELSSIWFRRNLLLSAESWPKATELVLRAPPTPIVVAVGDSLDVVVEAVRGRPRTVSLLYWEAGRPERVETLAETTAGTFRKTFENVARAFRFRVRGGDDEIGPFDVAVKLRPRIDMGSIRIWCRYPPYTGWPDTPPENPIRHGNLKVPTGTTVTFRMSANIDVSSAFFVYEVSEGGDPAALDRGADAVAGPSRTGGGEEDEWPAQGATALEVVDGRSFSGEFVAKENGQYYFQLESVDGFRGRRPDRFRVEVVPDRKPVVKIVEPERLSEEVTPRAFITVRVSASDDYGIAKGSVSGLYFPTPESGGAMRSFDIAWGDRSSEASGNKDLGRSADGMVEIDVARLSGDSAGPPTPGARFQYFAVVADSGGNLGESPIQVLEVVSEEELLRTFGELLMVVRDQLREIQRRQESARKDLAEFQAQLSGKIGAAEAAKLLRHQQEETRIAQALERQVGELDRILDRSLRNRVGDEKWRSWLSSVRSDLSLLALGKSREVSRSIEEIRKAAASAPQDPAQISAALAMQLQVEREIDAIVLRLSEFGDLNAVIQMLREVRRRQAEVREETRSRLGGGAKEGTNP